MNDRRFRWPAILLVAGCCAAGYAIGKLSGNFSIGALPTAENVGNRPDRSIGRQARGSENVWERFIVLLARNSRETDIWRVISRLPADQIPDALRDLRAVQFNAPTGSYEAKRLAEIESALYFHWAESDPQAALADVSTMPGEPDQEARARRTVLLKSVLAAWMRLDANAAYRAVKDHPDFGYTGRDMLVATWTPENVFQNADLYPDKHRDLIGKYFYAADRDDTLRSTMLTALKEQPEMKDRDWAYYLLFRAWAYRDFPAAMAEAEQHDHPGLVDHVLEDGLNRQPDSALRWAVSHDVPLGGPSWEQAYRNWLMFDADEAQSWLAKQSPEWNSNGKTEIVAGFLSAELDSKLSINGSVDHQASGEKLIALIGDWQAKDPRSASKWLETAPESARKLINGKGEDNHE